MADSRLTFHVPQEAGPAILIPLLEAIHSEQASFHTVAALLDFAQEHGFISRSETTNFALDSGLLQKADTGAIELSDAARILLALKPEVRPDIIHYVVYSGWHEQRPLEKTVFWSYRQVVDLLWQQCSTKMGGASNVMAEEIRNLIQESFKTDPSFSAKSIRGVRKWLEALTPPVMEDDLFSRRHFCPPELALLALGWVGQQSGGETGIDFLLTPERRSAICRVCLLDPSALDKVLDWTLPLYPVVVRPGTSAGAYGRFIRFLKWPELKDLLR